MDQIPSVLACDVGNSSIAIAHVKGDDVTPMQRLRPEDPAGLGRALAELWEQMPEPRKVAACSVNPPGLGALEAAGAEALHQDVLVIGRDLPLPIKTDLPHPASIGTDRLCCAAGAFDRLGVPCVVADFGTAITIDCVNADGVFIGGAILPGLAMGAKALAGQTALLPEVAPANPNWVFGKDTTQAIIGGLVLGARGALRELVESYASELGGWPIVILTGGDADLICPRPGKSELVQAVVPDLVLRGVAIGYYKSLLK